MYNMHKEEDMKKSLLLLVFCILFSFNIARAEFMKGYLDEMGDSDYFLLYTDKDEIDVEFDYPAGTSFWVLVLGENGDKLGYFDLSEGEIIKLTGGGYFTCVIISHRGDGKWTAYW
jgi:hypothetical protein